MHQAIFLLFSYVIVLSSILSMPICMRTGSISWPWTMTTIFSFFFSFFFTTTYAWFYVQYKYEREKEWEKNEVSRKKREKAKERENGQLLLFDGQSIDDKDYAIALSIVFWSNACLSLYPHTNHSISSSFFQFFFTDIRPLLNAS